MQTCLRTCTEECTQPAVMSYIHDAVEDRRYSSVENKEQFFFFFLHAADSHELINILNVIFIFSLVKKKTTVCEDRHLRKALCFGFRDRYTEI